MWGGPVAEAWVVGRYDRRPTIATHEKRSTSHDQRPRPTTHTTHDQDHDYDHEPRLRPRPTTHTTHDRRPRVNPWGGSRVVGCGSCVGRGRSRRSWVVGRCRGWCVVVVVVGRLGRGRLVVVGRGSWSTRRSWVVVVVVAVGRGLWSSRSVSRSVAASRSVSRSHRRISLSFRPSFRRSLRVPRRRGAQLLPSVCTRERAARGSDLHFCTALRLVLLRRVCGWAAWRPAPSSAREDWRLHGSDLRSRTESRLMPLRRVCR